MPKTKQRKVNAPMVTRVATIQPKTLNKENRTVEMVFTKGSRVRRFDFFDGPFLEELGLKKSEVRMKRLESGTAPFLDSHGFTEKRGVGAQLGVIVSAELIPEKEGRALVKFSQRDNVQDIFQDVEDGILRNVSVGYNVHKIEKVGEENEVPIFRATDWEPVEVSLVSAGADPEAQLRSADAQKTECIVIENETENKNIGDEDPSQTQKRSEPVNEMVAQPENLRDTQQIGENAMTPEEIEKKRQADIKQAKDEAKAAEKIRQTEIRSIFSKTKLEDKELLQECIDSDKTADEVRTLVIDKLAERNNKAETQTVSANQVRVGEDHGRKGRIEGMTSAILHRHRPADETVTHDGKKITMRGHELIESGRQFAYLSLVDMARACLEANGVRTGMMPKHVMVDQALTRGLHSTADFPEILANVVNKTLRAGYQSAPVTWRPFVNEVFVNDFKEISRTNLGDAAKLEKLGEGSEVKRGTISEAAEKYQVEEYAKILGITRKIIINDDLNFVARLPERMGRRARDLESDTIWDIIKANAALADTFALFSAQHGNLSTVPAAPDEAGLSEGRKLMRRQTGLDGAEISLSPVWMFVPPEHETAAEKLIASIVPDSSTNVSPFSAAGRTPLRLDVEPRLETGPNGSTNAWYLTADRGQVDMIELARLAGSNGPQTVTKEGFDVHGMEIKIMHDIGAKAIDHRGLFKNAGA